MQNSEFVGERAIENSVEEEEEEEPMIKKAKLIEGNEQVPLLDMEEKKETCVVVSVDSISVEEEKDETCVELESNEKTIDEVDVVSGDVNIEKKETNDASVKLADTSSGIKEEMRSNPIVLQKKLLVLDLNGLLAAIVSPLADVKADINIGRQAIFKRPHCEDFLEFCFDKFEVGIWSSRDKNSIDRITEFLFGNMKSKLLFCWDISYCTTTTLGSRRPKWAVFKDLNRLWEKHYPKLPWNKGDYNETNTVLLDDSPSKALLNPPYTAIFPHSYNHQNKTDISLGNGGDLRLHLEKLVEAENVQDFIKKNHFGQEAITEASESWDFYQEAIRMLQMKDKRIFN